MDDTTRKTTPEHETGPLNPIDNIDSTGQPFDSPAQTKPASQPETQVQRGASMTEFTQMTPRQNAPRVYAMPEAEPFDSTLPSLVPTIPPNVPPNVSQNMSPRFAATPVPQPMQQAMQQVTQPNAAVSINDVTVPSYMGATPYPALQPQPKSAGQKQNWLWVAVAVALFSTSVLLSIGAFLFLRFTVNNGNHANNGNSAVVADNSTQNGGGDGVNGTAGNGTQPAPTMVNGVLKLTTATPAPTATLGLDIQAWDGQRRLTILMMGIDKRPNDKGTAFRTDSIMLVSIDPKTKSVGILSVPRDLFVDIPTDTVITNSYGLQRVNAAYVIGELARPGYGPQLAMQTLQYNLGIRINNYVVYEFSTVINAIDMIGGVDINVPSPIYDAMYPNMFYGFEPLRIPAGLIHMDGTLALKYGRTRHQTSDFDRVKRQQQVVMAVREKIINNNMLPELLGKAPQLWDQLSKTTRTDLDFTQMVRLAVYLKDVPKENIKQGLIDIQYVTGLNYQGQDILLPERAKLGPLFEQIFGANYNS